MNQLMNKNVFHNIQDMRAANKIQKLMYLYLTHKRIA